MACEMPGSQGELMATSLEEFSIEQVQILDGRNCSIKARRFCNQRKKQK